MWEHRDGGIRRKVKMRKRKRRRGRRRVEEEKG